MCDQQRLRPACIYAQSDQSICLLLEYSLTIKLLTEYHLEFLSLIGRSTSSSESIHVKMPSCWKSLVAAHIILKMNGLMIAVLLIIYSVIYIVVLTFSPLIVDQQVHISITSLRNVKCNGSAYCNCTNDVLVTNIT